MAKPEYEGGTTVEVLDRDEAGNATSHIEQDRHGNRWHVVKGKEPKHLRDGDDVAAARG